MDLYYFKEHLHDELTDACEYARRGLEIKPMSSDWGKALMRISAEELGHAGELYKMYNEYIGKLNETYQEKPKYMIEIEEDISKFYPDMVVKVKMMHEIYK